MMEEKKLARLDTLKTNIKDNLLEYLGKPLYDILEGKETDAPFGFKGKFDLYDKSLGITKSFGKDYRLGFDFNKKNPFGIRDDYRLTLKKEF